MTLLISYKDFIPPPTANGILASSLIFLTKSKEINLFSLLALISKKINSSDFKSLKNFTAFIGSPIIIFLKLNRLY